MVDGKMSVPAHQFQLSAEEYLQFEESSIVRHEYVGGRLFAVVGSTDAHNTINVNLTVLIGSKIRGSGCRVYANDMKVKVEATNSFYYPDLLISCEPYSAKSMFKVSPCLIVEILSESTADVDLREKLAAYKTIPSVNEYAVFYQNKRKAELYKRSHNQWTVSIHDGDDNFVLSPGPKLEIPLSLSEIYEGVVNAD